MNNSTILLLFWFLLAAIIEGVCFIRHLQHATHDLTDVHFQFHGKQAAFVPIPSCVLPPPQPFYMIILFNIAKVLFASFFFSEKKSERIAREFTVGILPRDSEDARRQFHVARQEEVASTGRRGFCSCGRFRAMLKFAYFWYSIIMPSVTAVSTFWKVLGMGPFRSGWGHYQCLGVAFVLGPWLYNSLLAMFMVEVYRGRRDVEGEDNLQVTQSVVVEEGRSNLCNPGALITQYKSSIKHMVAIATLLPCLPVLLPITCTHMVPGPMVSLPNALVFVPLLFTAFLMIRGSRTGIFFHRVLGGFWMLACVPGLSALSIYMQLVVLQFTYICNGMEVWDAMALVWVERRAQVYADNFEEKVLNNMVWLLDIINQVF